jgi:two-component Ni(II)/redox sensor kinase NrsS
MSMPRPLAPTLLWRARLRLAGLSLLVMGAILYASGLAMARLLLYEQETAIKRELQTLAGTLHDSLKPTLPPVPQPTAALSLVLPGLCVVGERCAEPVALVRRHAISATDPSRFQLRILNPLGRLIAMSPGAPPLGSGVPQTGWLQRQEGDGSRQLTYTIHLHRSHGNGQQDWGYLQISRSLLDLDAEAQRLWWLGHGVFALAMAGMALASWWLAGLAMTPLIEAYQRQEQFSADVAHELRTPLANLLALVEAERSGTGSSRVSMSTASLDRVMAQGRRLQQLIADLLLLASLERPVAESQKQICDLAEITADVLEDFSEAAAAAEVTLVEGMSVLHQARVLGNAAELSRLVINLLSNALQHTPAAGRIGVGLEQRAGEIVLRISDSGPGIPPEEQQRIFDRFTRLDPARSRQQGGTGLGLAIAQSIARRHGGLITVQSTQGEGATFSLRLPALA